MSIASNMKKYMLQVKTTEKTSSGLKKEVWKDVQNIDVSILKKSSTLNTQSVKYNDSTHVGITFYQNIKEGLNRLVDGDRVLSIIDVTQGRKKVLLLKEVDKNV